MHDWGSHYESNYMPYCVKLADMGMHRPLITWVDVIGPNRKKNIFFYESPL